MQFGLRRLPLLALYGTVVRQLYVHALPATVAGVVTTVTSCIGHNSQSDTIRKLQLRGGSERAYSSTVPVGSGAPPDLPDVIPTDRSFVALKPDAVRRGLVGEIIKRFERKGLKLVAIKGLQPGQEQTEQHYAEHHGQYYFPRLVNFFRSGPIIAMVWEGPNAIKNIRRIVGKTHPEDAEAGTIRGDYSYARGENLVHCSDSNVNAEREIAVWFEESDFFDS